MKVAKVSRKAKIRAGIRCLKSRLLFGMSSSLARFIGKQHSRSVGEGYYDAEIYQRQFKRSLKKEAREVKRELVLERNQIQKIIKQLEKMKAKTTDARKSTLIEREIQKNKGHLMEIREILMEKTMAEIGISDAETRKRFFRMQKFKKKKKKQ